MAVFINLALYVVFIGFIIFAVILGIRKAGKHGVQHSVRQDEATRRLHNEQHQRMMQDPYLNPGVDVVVDRHYHGLDQHQSGNDHNNGNGGFNNGL
ncbi:hypothetical protein [Paenibacillus fonticola]|uniref:hypothetical protein n=1 Tax=Paenibacillus fonticola TaxID=379896 RepID=UPI000365FCF1|nr:hypothetical protein [Paenibacillus fonticola]